MGTLPSSALLFSQNVFSAMSQPEIAQRGTAEASQQALCKTRPASSGSRADALPWWPHGQFQPAGVGVFPADEYPLTYFFANHVHICYLILALLCPSELGRAAAPFAGEETEAQKELGPAQDHLMPSSDRGRQGAGANCSLCLSPHASCCRAHRC